MHARMYARMYIYIILLSSLASSSLEDRSAFVLETACIISGVFLDSYPVTWLASVYHPPFPPFNHVGYSKYQNWLTHKAVFKVPIRLKALLDSVVMIYLSFKNCMGPFFIFIFIFILTALWNAVKAWYCTAVSYGMCATVHALRTCIRWVVRGSCSFGRAMACEG